MLNYTKTVAYSFIWIRDIVYFYLLSTETVTQSQEQHSEIMNIDNFIHSVKY